MPDPHPGGGPDLAKTVATRPSARHALRYRPPVAVPPTGGRAAGPLRRPRWKAGDAWGHDPGLQRRARPGRTAETRGPRANAPQPGMRREPSTPPSSSVPPVRAAKPIFANATSLPAFVSQ